MFPCLTLGIHRHSTALSDLSDEIARETYCPRSIYCRTQFESPSQLDKSIQGKLSGVSIHFSMTQWQDCEVRPCVLLDSRAQSLRGSFRGNKAVKPGALTGHSLLHFVEVKLQDSVWQWGVTCGPRLYEAILTDQQLSHEGGLEWPWKPISQPLRL